MAESGERPGAGHRLDRAPSAYLRSAAAQSIDWHPWGSEPFEIARRTHRPVLLDIGAAWCHWCHVMDEGTYSDAEVARLINENFVAVKVDRDENPEVDRRYQRQVGALTGEGGWPLTAFLTPGGEAFLGGTYFPPDDGLGRPGFRRVLREVAKLWTHEPKKVSESTGALRAALERLGDPRPSRPLSTATLAIVAQVRERLSSIYDPVNGGFGHAPKFPHPTAVSFLLWDGFASGGARSTSHALDTLLRMADGGMYDHLGGGFHRYSVDEAWHIPHFEKMGVDNAELLRAYVEGAERFGEPRLLETVRGSLTWVRTVLEDPDGGFGASQDADNAPGDDGRYFTWSRSDLKAILDPVELRIASRYFGLGTEGRMPHDPDQNVLYRLMPIPEIASGLGQSEEDASRILERAIERMRGARTRRAAPTVDPAQYASINGSFIGSFSRAGRFLADRSVLESARRAADAFLSKGFDASRGVAHRIGNEGARGFGLLEDNASFALGLVELAGATADPRYAAAADSLLALIEREFSDASGLLRDIAPTLYDGPALPAVKEPLHPVEDQPHLSANAATAIALVRWASLSGRASVLDRARSLLAAILPRVEGAGLFAAGTALAVGLTATPAARVVVEGSGPDAESLARAAERSWHPNLWVFRGLPPPPFSLPEEIESAATRGDSSARALVCFGSRCLAPISEPAALSEAIRSADRPAA